MRRVVVVCGVVMAGCLEIPTATGRSHTRIVGTGNCGDDPSLADVGISAKVVYSVTGQTRHHRGWNHARVELHNVSDTTRQLHASGANVIENGPKERCSGIVWPLDRTLAPNEAIAFDLEMQIDDAPAGEAFTISLPMRVDDQTTCTDIASFVAVR